MRIEIDTKNDSKEEIVNAIRLLMSAAKVNGCEVFSNEAAALARPAGDDLLSVFSDKADKEPPKDNDGYINIFAPNPVEDKPKEAKTASDNPFAGFFDSPSEPSPSLQQEEQETKAGQTERSFFKEYEDEDPKKKHRITFY